MSIQVVADNTEEFVQAMKSATGLALELIGMSAEAHAKEMCPVDTSNLQQSITHIVNNDEVVIGTNVEYAVYVEMDDTKNHPNGQAHFLHDAASNYTGEYAQIIESQLK